MDNEVILAAYRSFNERDMEAVLALMTDDVNWTNGLAGGRIKGKAELRRIWTLQWTSVNPTSEVLGISVDAEGRTIVRVRQVLHEVGGLLLNDQEIEQVFTLRDGLIARMDFRHID
jgi:hypothetical protein